MTHRPTVRGRAALVVVLTGLLAWFGLLAPTAHALLLETIPADPTTGTVQTPTTTVLTFSVLADAGTPMPATATFALGDGVSLRLPAVSACDAATAASDPAFCPETSIVGAGELDTADLLADMSVYAVADGSLAMKVRSVPRGAVDTIATARLGGDGRSLTMSLPPSLRGSSLETLRLRLGKDDPAVDFLRMSTCPAAGWASSVTLRGFGGEALGDASSQIGCRPPRKALLGKIVPTFSLSQRRVDGVLSPQFLTGVTLPPGLPADATVHVTCVKVCRGAWSSGVNPGGVTTVRIRRPFSVASRSIQLQIAVASPTVRGTYLRLRFTRGPGNKVKGWVGTARGCVRLGSAPARMPCPR